jgi:hypothetical protein
MFPHAVKAASRESPGSLERQSRNDKIIYHGARTYAPSTSVPATSCAFTNPAMGGTSRNGTMCARAFLYPHCTKCTANDHTGSNRFSTRALDEVLKHEQTARVWTRLPPGMLVVI